MKYLLILLSIIGLMSCAESKKTSASASATTTSGPSDAELIKEGYVSGVIHARKGDSQCAYTIETRELDYLLDPTNLESEYMKGELKVWLKFIPLRMQNRCPEANPIEIIDIMMRQ